MNQRNKTTCTTLANQTITTSALVNDNRKVQTTLTNIHYCRSRSDRHPQHNRYTPPTTNHLVTQLCIAISALLLTTASSASQAGEIITYPGYTLANDPIINVPNSLFPLSSLTDNQITINNNIAGYIYGGVTTGNGQVSNNKVTIRDGIIGGRVYGGYSSSGAVTDNAITILGGTMQRDIFGGYSGSGAVTGNTITIQDGTIDLDIYGGYSDSGAVTGNAVTIYDGTLQHDTYGSYSNFGAVTGNAITIYGGTLQGSVIGGYSGKTTTGNTVTIHAGTLAGEVFGGLSDSEATTSNAVTIHGGTMNSSIYGGFSVGGDATDNTVTIHGGTLGGFVYGGYSHSKNASGNAVTVHDGTMNSNIYGGYSYSGAATNNAANIHNGTLLGYVYGGYSLEGAATGNAVTIHAGAMQQNVYGGYSHFMAATSNTVTIHGGTLSGFVYGGYSNSGDATSNAVTIHNGTLCGFVYGGYSYSKNATSNAVTIHDGTLAGFVYGGYSDFGTATSNTVTILGGTIQRSVYGGSSNSGVASGNTVTIHAGTIQESVYGGYGYSRASGNAVTIYDGTVQGFVLGGYSFNEAATDNTVTIHGGRIDSDIYGGFSGSEDATGNTVIITGTPQFNASTSLYGGSNPYGSTDMFSANSLIFSARPITINNVANFERYNFAIDPSLANKPTALITTSNSIRLGNGSGTPSTIEVIGIHTGNPLQVNDRFVLMQTNDLTGDGLGKNSIVRQGISLLYDIRTDVDFTGNQITATVVNGARTNPQLKALSEGHLAGIMLVTRGADMIADDAFNAINAQNNQNGLAPFLIFSGNHLRYNSGSHIKSNDRLLTTGLSYQQHNLTLGVFLETGWGNYDTYNSFYNIAKVHGDGNSRYYGLGALGRYDFANGFYTDASVRAGRNRNKFDTADIVNPVTGQYTHYTLKSNYASVHIGAGYLLPLNDQSQLDLSAKYLYSTLGGKNTTVAGDPIQFKRLNSHRTKINASLNHQYNPTLTLKVGLGYEHEFDGKAKATTYGRYQIDPASVRGGTAILSLGATIKPTTQPNLTLDLKANGYTGKREGVGATIGINYAF